MWAWSPTDGPLATGIFSQRWDHSLASSPHGELLALARTLEALGLREPALGVATDAGHDYDALGDDFSRQRREVAEFIDRYGPGKDRR